MRPSAAARRRLEIRRTPIAHLSISISAAIRPAATTRIAARGAAGDARLPAQLSSGSAVPFDSATRRRIRQPSAAPAKTKCRAGPIQSAMQAQNQSAAQWGGISTRIILGISSRPVKYYWPGPGRKAQRSRHRYSVKVLRVRTEAAVENAGAPARTLARDSSSSVDSSVSTTTSRAADPILMRTLLNDAGFPVERRFVIQAMRRRIAASAFGKSVQDHFRTQIEEDLNVLDQ